MESARWTPLGGQGVLVPGGFVLTATHCIPWDGNGRMALGDVYPVTVVTHDGRQFRLGVACCDPVSICKNCDEYIPASRFSRRS